MVKATLRKKNTAPVVVVDTSAQPVDENAAERLAQELGVGSESASPGPEPVEVEVVGSEETGPATAGTASSGSTAVAHRPSSAMATRTASLGGAFEGDFDDRDVRLPQLKIVAGNGPLSERFAVGSLIYADELLFNPPSKEANAVNPILRIVPVKIQKQWRENLTEDEIAEGIMPRVFNSIEEAVEAHGPTCARWANDEKPRVAPSGRCLILLEEPKDCKHPGFMRPLDGRNHAPAILYAGGTAYGEFVKPIFNKLLVMGKPADGCNPINAFYWEFRVGTVKRGKFNVFAPSVKLTKDPTGPELRAYAEELRSTRVQDAE